MVSFFLNKTVVTICLNLSILLIGLFSYKEIANEFLPAVAIPAVAIVYPITVTPHETAIDELVKPLEKRFLEDPNVEKVECEIDGDRVVMIVHFSWAVLPEAGLQRSRQLVQGIPRPPGVLEPLLILHRPTLSPIFRVAIYGKTSDEMTSELQKVAAQVERIRGVSQVRLLGASPKTGSIDLDMKEMARLKVSPSHIVQSAVEVWSFRNLISLGERKVLVENKLPGIEALSDMPVLNSQGQSFPLRQVSRVRSGFARPSIFINGKQDAIIIEVLKSPGADTLGIADSTQDILGRTDLKTQILYNEAEKIREAQKGVMQNFAVGVLLNSLVLLIFLGSSIGALVASCVFPTAILGTLFVMKSMGMSLNIFALNGFSLASGMITDASIVVLESIIRRYQLGDDLLSACARGTNDVFGGVLASGITTAAVILPIGMQTGIASKLFSDLGITLVATQFICLITVFTLVPWLCSRILTDAAPKGPIRILYQQSQNLVAFLTGLSSHVMSLARSKRAARLGIPTIATVLSLTGIIFLPNSEFLPQVASKIYSLVVPVKRNRLSDENFQLKQQVAERLKSEKQVNWSVTQSSTDTIQSIVSVEDPLVLEQTVQDLAKSMGVPKNRFVLRPLGPTPSGEILGADGYFYIRKDISNEKKTSLVKAFCQSPGILNCIGDDQYREPKVSLLPHPLLMFRAQTNLLETSLNMISTMHSLDLSAISGLPLAESVLLKMPKNQLLDLPYHLGKGKDTTLSNESMFSSLHGAQSSRKLRVDGSGYSPLLFRIEGITIGQAINKMSELVQVQGLESDAVRGVGGIESMNETFSKMMNALMLSAFLIFAILTIQFKSVIQAGIIMYSIPLSLGGAIAGLVIYGETINVGVLVGFILLVGIIVNNGILLVEAINQRLISQFTVYDAIVDAVQSRTRPILMTTFSTVLGMAPTLLFEAEGAELYRGMAIVNIFGMTLGTLLTLVVTPVLIYLVSKPAEAP